MVNSRLVSLIKTLSHKEIKDLRLFLSSPFFNKRQEVIDLFEYIVKNRQGTAQDLSKSEVYTALQGKKVPYNDQQLRLWMSFLLKLCEQFLVYRVLKEDEILTDKYLVSIYRERNLPKQQERQLRLLEQNQSTQVYRNANFYWEDFQIEFKKYRFAATDRRMSELNLQKVSTPLDIAFIIQKLQQACLALAHQAVYKTDYEFSLIPEILAHIQQKSLFNIPAVAVYYYGYLLLSQPDTQAHFRNFKKNLVEHQHLFPQEERGDLYLLGINFCIKKYNAGDRQFLVDEFELYQQGLEQNLLLKNNQLSRFTYRNVVTLGLVIGEHSWVEKFIDDYRSKLDKAHRLSMYSFCRAQLAYSRKEYDEALQLLQRANYKDVLLNLAAKTVMLKIFYELDEYDFLHAHLDAMRTFIRRKKIMGYHRENYVNLVYYTRKLLELNPFDRSEKQEILKGIENSKVIAERDWLINNLQS